ncbi:MAG: HD domain-containing phosphohydrolase [Pseudomonadota bacterium]
MAFSYEAGNESITTISEINKLSHDKKLNKLLTSVLSKVKNYAEAQIAHIKQDSKIGLALSSEKNIDKLLEMIVTDARKMTNADAGTLYIIDKKNKYLCFKILQNDTLNVRMGGTSGVNINLPSVPLFVDGKQNHSNVSSYVAITGEIVNIPDVYEARGFDFTGPMKYDASTGYRSKSMLVIPLRNHENDIIGVLQLLNSQDPLTGEVIAFPTEYIDETASLASQAAVALTNTQLIQDLKDLFYSFIKTIATAIDEKSPYTWGHINRVVNISMLIAEGINKSKKKRFVNTKLDENELEEIRIAAWMHDVGKITTPEYVIDKSTKLQTVFDRINLVETRFNLIAKTLENEYLKIKIKHLKTNKNEKKFAMLDSELEEKLKVIENDFELIKSSNIPGEYLKEDVVIRLKEIARKTYLLNNKKQPYISEEELENLIVRKGSITAKERKIIENHAAVTYKILSQLPFPRKLVRVPEYASGHHEKLDGSGYPRALTEEDLPLQSRIIAIADIFEALTAKDRPYKKPMNLKQALKIMSNMKKNNIIDADIYDLFIEKKLYEKFFLNEAKNES